MNKELLSHSKSSWREVFPGGKQQQRSENLLAKVQYDKRNTTLQRMWRLTSSRCFEPVTRTNERERVEWEHDWWYGYESFPNRNADPEKEVSVKKGSDGQSSCSPDIAMKQMRHHCSKDEKTYLDIVFRGSKKNQRTRENLDWNKVVKWITRRCSFKTTM